MNNTKVLFILSVPPPYGGGEIVSEILYNELKKNKDYSFSLISKKNFSKSKQANVNVYSFIYSLKFITLNMVRIIFNNPDSIYIGLPKGFSSFLRNAIIIFFAKIFRKRVFAEIHGMSFPFVEKSKWKLKVLLIVINKIQSIRVLAYSIKKYLIDFGYKGSIYVVNNGVKKPDISLVEHSHNFINILYLGAISEAKGFFRVLEVLSSLNKRTLNNIKLNVIGEWVHQNEKVNSIRYINEHQLYSNVTFLGKQVNEKKWKLISKNKLMIHLTSFDGQPLTIIETMSIGIPTIATKVGAIPEMISNGYNGYLIDNDNEVKILLEQLVNNDFQMEQIKKNAIDTYYKKYRPSLMAKGIERMIN